ncbi:FGFR1 oncogene partner-like [Fopius arisanus]|uniref:FGFR1 oncogene partner-like n=1 Tax=Fopius arisanus TaxID=64838 RepID=A0A9R1TJ01_9HYME|nr:PREDICTED: FGFR1 oncogene partner-like [Fopius arisanus]
MIDGNISMEEDTELRDLVVQTLENNGVLAKVRAELRASVFLALEEQESVANPEPLLNKTVKQYLSNSEGKLLFSLVREFLEYFALDYTISVYDPETYVGKEYNYIGRNKLCEKLGISTTEPLLGELLKNSINGAFNNSEKNDSNDSRLNKTTDTSANNATFEVKVPKIIHKDSPSFSNDNDSSEKGETVSDMSQDIPINVTITDKKITNAEPNNPKTSSNSAIDKSLCELRHESSRESTSIENTTVTGNNNKKADDCPVDKDNSLNESEQFLKFDETIGDSGRNEEMSKLKLRKDVEIQNTNNAQNRIIDGENNFSKTVYFDEIIVDGKRERVGGGGGRRESLLGDLPPIGARGNSIFTDLPPLNGKKTNINDLKELMDMGLAGEGVDNYEEDFASSASGSANEASPIKDSDKNPSQSPGVKNQKDEKSNSARSEEISEEIEDEVLSANVSCVSDPIVI